MLRQRLRGVVLTRQGGRLLQRGRLRHAETSLVRGVNRLAYQPHFQQCAGGEWGLRGQRRQSQPTTTRLRLTRAAALQPPLQQPRQRQERPLRDCELTRTADEQRGGREKRADQTHRPRNQHHCAATAVAGCCPQAQTASEATAQGSQRRPSMPPSTLVEPPPHRLAEGLSLQRPRRPRERSGEGAALVGDLARQRQTWTRLHPPPRHLPPQRTPPRAGCGGERLRFRRTRSRGPQGGPSQTRRQRKRRRAELPVPGWSKNGLARSRETPLQLRSTQTAAGP